MLGSFIRNPITGAAGWTIIHSIWQAATIAAMLALVLLVASLLSHAPINLSPVDLVKAAVDLVCASLFRLVSKAKTTLLFIVAIAIWCEPTEAIPTDVVSHAENII